MKSEEMRGELRVLQRLNEYEYGVSIRCLRSGENRNGWDYQNLDQHYLSFCGVPILCAYRRNGEVGDGHNMSLKVDPKTGEKYYSFTDATSERIVGTLSDDPADITLNRDDTGEWIEAKGRLFRFYARELVDKIIEAGTMEVSAETEIHEEYTNEQGVDVFLAWDALGITILGDGVAPAIPGARITALAAMQEEFAELKLRAASLREGASPNAEGPEGQEETPPDEPAEDDGGVKINSEKGVTKHMILFNKTQLAALSEFTGWTAVQAGKDDDGIHVALMNDKGEFARYTMNSETDTFAPERVEKIAVSADFGGGLTVDVADLMGDMRSAYQTNAALLESVTAERDAHAETIRTMTERENEHRKADAKRLAVDTLAAFNANREEKVEAAVLDAVNADIDKGVYLNSEDGAEVAKTVKALCADAVAAMDKRNAEANRRSYIWENAARNEAAGDDGSLASLLSRYNMD